MTFVVSSSCSVSARVVRFSPTRWRGLLLSSTPCSCTVWCSWYVSLQMSTCFCLILSSKIPPGSLWSSFRCYTRPRGARALAETAPLSVLKSEIIHPRSLFCSSCSLCMVPNPPLLLLFPTGMLTISTSSMRMTQTSKLVSPPWCEEAGLAACMSSCGTDESLSPVRHILAVTITPARWRFITRNRCLIELNVGFSFLTPTNLDSNQN